MSFPIPGKDTLKQREYCNPISYRNWKGRRILTLQSTVSVLNVGAKGSDTVVSNRTERFQTPRPSLRIRDALWFLDCGFDRSAGGIAETSIDLEAILHRSISPFDGNVRLSLEK
jgi:hypothetical protein